MAEVDDELRDRFRRAGANIDSPLEWSTVQRSVGRRRKRTQALRLGGGLVALGLVAVVAVQLYSQVAPGPRLTISEDTVAPEEDSVQVPVLTEEEEHVLADIRELRDDLAEGKLVIDWRAAQDSPEPGESLLGAFPSAEEFLVFLEEELRGPPLPQVSIFLKDSATLEEIRSLQRELAGWPEVKAVVFISKEEALARLKEQLKDHPEVVAGLSANPLPRSFELYLENPRMGSSVAQRLEKRPEVDEVRAGTISKPVSAQRATELVAYLRGLAVAPELTAPPAQRTSSVPPADTALSVTPVGDVTWAAGGPDRRLFRQPCLAKGRVARLQHVARDVT